MRSRLRRRSSSMLPLRRSRERAAATTAASLGQLDARRIAYRHDLHVAVRPEGARGSLLKWAASAGFAAPQRVQTRTAAAIILAAIPRSHSSWLVRPGGSVPPLHRAALL